MLVKRHQIETKRIQIHPQCDLRNLAEIGQYRPSNRLSKIHFESFREHFRQTAHRRTGITGTTEAFDVGGAENPLFATKDASNWPGELFGAHRYAAAVSLATLIERALNTGKVHYVDKKTLGWARRKPTHCDSRRRRPRICRR